MRLKSKPGQVGQSDTRPDRKTSVDYRFTPSALYARLRYVAAGISMALLAGYPSVLLCSSLSETCYNPFVCDKPDTIDDMVSWIKGISSEPHSFKESELYFGEEFEYWTDAPFTKEGLYFDTSESNFTDSVPFIYEWYRLLVEKLKESGIPLSDYLVEISGGNSMDSRENIMIQLRIGNWRCTVYLDAKVHYDKQDSMIEINVSPYRINQIFKIAGISYSVYYLFDNFIFDIAKKMNLRPTVGHKHVDLLDSVGSNQALLFRMLVDVENKAWLSRYFGCEHDSGLTEQGFVYLIQADDDGGRSHKLSRLVEAFNSGHGTVHRDKPLLPQPAIQEFANRWRCGFNMTEKLIPADIRITNNSNWPFLDNTRAKHGEVVLHPQSGTLEYRFFPTPGSGKEVLLFNRMLARWFTYLASRQNDQSPIEYTPYDPLKNDETSDSLQNRFSTFLREIGLNPKQYTVFRRQGCEKSVVLPSGADFHSEL